VLAINTPAETENKISFRWTYVILPVALFLLSLILAVCFYPFLPDEIAYHFQNDSPDKWFSRGAYVGWMVVPQILFALLSIIIVRIVMLTARYLPQCSSPLPSLLPLMGNIISLPQIVLIFAMLNFFLYNVYQINLIPLWIFTVVVLVAGAIILVVFFIRTMRRYRRRQVNIRQE